MDFILFLLLVIYLASLVVSAYRLVQEYYAGRAAGYNFRWFEICTAIILPFVPMLNTLWIIWTYS